jgi:CHAD domain-containing protein
MAKDSALTWDESASPGANARRHLPDLVLSYYREGRKAAEDGAAADALHQFRLRTKRLRYTLELFRVCYGPGLQRCLAALGRIQEHLGAISDCATAGSLCPGQERLKAYLDKRAAREAAAFRRYWRNEFDQPGQARRWEIYFRRSK